MIPEFLRNRNTYMLTAIIVTIIGILGLSFAFFQFTRIENATVQNVIIVETLKEEDVIKAFTLIYDDGDGVIDTGIINAAYSNLYKFRVISNYNGNLEISINWKTVTSTINNANSSYDLYSCTEDNYNIITISNATSTCSKISPVTGNVLPETGAKSKLQSDTSVEITGNSTNYYAVVANVSASEIGKGFVGSISVKHRSIYTLALNLDGGESLSPLSIDMTVGSSVTITVPTKTGYTFGSWNETEGNGYIDENNYTMGTSDAILKAIWIPNTYYVAFDCDGGANGAANQRFTYDKYQSLTKNQCYKIITGASGRVKVFAGWSFEDKTFTDAESVLNLTSENNVTATIKALWKDLFYYNKTYSVYDDTNLTIPETIGNYRVRFYASGTLTYYYPDQIDVFAVGGGGGGGYGQQQNVAGSGGAGGKTSTVKNINVNKSSTFAIVVGGGGSAGISTSSATGGTGGTSSFGNSLVTADGGTGGSYTAGGSGGSGGGATARAGGSNGSDGVIYNCQYKAGLGQHTTTCEFGEGLYGNSCNAGYQLFAGGGGGGGENGNGGAGGTGGGGTGGHGNYSSQKTAPTSGTSFTGGGGGGGDAYMYSAAGAGGGSGIVIIRNSR